MHGDEDRLLSGARPRVTQSSLKPTTEIERLIAVGVPMGYTYMYVPVVRA
jgi:hypothetical protein